MKFEWDEAKSEANRTKHGISLSEACALWEGPVLVVDSIHPLEDRKLAIGRIAGKPWTVIFTLRGGRIRLISARRSRNEERKAYHEKDNLRQP